MKLPKLRLKGTPAPDPAANPWRAVCDLLEDGVCLLDGDGKVVHWNRAFAELTGKSASGIAGQKVATLLTSAFGSNAGRLPSLSDPVSTVVEADNGRGWFRLTMRPLNGSDAACVLLIADATREKRAERALQKSEKLAAVGKLAGTLAHEINNPVASVANALFLLDRCADLDESSREYLEMARVELTRVSEVVRQTLGFYRETGRPIPVEPARVLDDVLELQARQIQARSVTIRKRYDFKGEVVAFPADLRHVLSNVLQNALEAVPQGGTIRLHISRSHAWKQPEIGGVRIVIADDGAGVPRELRQRVLEPFFTTKNDGGSGLGLWVADCILREQGGYLHLRNGVPGTNRGLAVAIFLPDHVESKPGTRSSRRGLPAMHVGA